MRFYLRQKWDLKVLRNVHARGTRLCAEKSGSKIPLFARIIHGGLI